MMRFFSFLFLFVMCSGCTGTLWTTSKLLGANPQQDLVATSFLQKKEMVASDKLTIRGVGLGTSFSRVYSLWGKSFSKVKFVSTWKNEKGLVVARIHWKKQKQGLVVARLILFQPSRRFLHPDNLVFMSWDEIDSVLSRRKFMGYATVIKHPFKTTYCFRKKGLCFHIFNKLSPLFAQVKVALEVAPAK